MELWQGLKSGTINRHITRVSKNRTVARIKYSRGGGEASATRVKVASICTSDVKAEELDSPLAWGRGWVVRT
jgi:Tfp pilus assembly protein FimT